MPAIERGGSSWRAALGIAVGAEIIASAGLTSIVVCSRSHVWLAWVCLVPLFHVIRTRSACASLVAGGAWGFCLYFFAAAADSAHVRPTDLALVLLTAVPALYAAGAAVATRVLGFNPVLLGAGWILVELALRPLGLEDGLLASTQVGGVQVGWIADLLGYGLVAMVVAGINATLFALLDSLRVRLPRQQLWRRRGPRVCGFTRPASRPYGRHFLTRAIPRGPPAVIT